MNMTATSLESFRQELMSQNIEVVEHNCTQDIHNHNCRTCVLGVLLSDYGKEIEQYMLSWLTKKYNVISIRQSVPGVLFEFPALRFAQLFSTEFKVPVLYLHTKGAAHKGRFQRKTINMWRFEFVESKLAYEEKMEQYDVLLPYSGPQKITWFNGFIASSKAFSSISPIKVLENRFIYEILFKGSSLKFYGRRIDHIQRSEALENTSVMYHDINRFSASFSYFSNQLHYFVCKHLPRNNKH